MNHGKQERKNTEATTIIRLHIEISVTISQQSVVTISYTHDRNTINVPAIRSGLLYEITKIKTIKEKKKLENVYRNSGR
jgi:hypothetical protein